MNRLLLFGLVSAMLLALSYGEQISKDQSLTNLDENEPRTLREVQQDPAIKRARGRKNKAIDPEQKRKSKRKSSNVIKKRSNKDKHGNKNKNKMIKRTNKKKDQMRNRKKTNNKKFNLKSKKMTNKKLNRNGKKKNKSKSKKNGKTNGKNKGKKNSKRTKNKKIKIVKRKKMQPRKPLGKGARQTSCIQETCIDNAVSYIKLSKDKVKNYLLQVTRVGKFNKSAGSKAGKKGLFSPIINRIREAGGGNISNLKCNGNSTGNGAQVMTNLTNALGACESNINKSCVTNLPTINVAETKKCKSSMETFEAMIKKCMALTGTSACSCWNNQSFTTIVASIKPCDHSAENKKMTSAKKSCIAAFGACRKLEDSVSETISACSPGNTASNGKKDLKNGKANKAAASSLLQKINETIKGTSRSITNLTCAAFGIKMKKINDRIFTAPLNAKTSSIINLIVNQSISACSSNETTQLQSEEIKLADNTEIIDEAMEDIQNDLKIQTGTTTSITSLGRNLPNIISSFWPSDVHAVLT